MTPEVGIAIDELRAAFPGRAVDVASEAQGGAYVIVHDLEIGGGYTPSTSWVGFLIPFNYPYPDIYPHYIDVGVRRADGHSLEDGLSGPTSWPGWPDGSVIQVSRRSNRWNPMTDTAALKLEKVLAWLRQR